MSTQTTQKAGRWLLPEAKNQPLSPGLYLVSTPIGNLRDITIRALDTLAAVDVVLCENVKVSRKLLNFYGIEKKLEGYNDHSDERARGKIIKAIKDGKRLALISDAGTPLISDPGYKLVQDCLQEGVFITTLPGANSPLSALQLSGFPSHAFTFLGFLPTKQMARQAFLKAWQHSASTLILFEAGNRLDKTLHDLDQIYGDRKVAVVREITKLYEEVRCERAHALLDFYQENGAPKGEIVIVVEPVAPKVFGEQEVDEALQEALKTMNTKAAAKSVAEVTGLPTSELYNRALALKS